MQPGSVQACAEHAEVRAVLVSADEQFGVEAEASRACRRENSIARS